MTKMNNRFLLESSIFELMLQTRSLIGDHLSSDMKTNSAIYKASIYCHPSLIFNDANNKL